MWHPISSRTRPNSPATSNRPARRTHPGTPGGTSAPLRRRLRAEQPAAGQRRRRLEGLRRQRDHRSREARQSSSGLPAARRRQPGRHRRLSPRGSGSLRRPLPGRARYLIFGQVGWVPRRARSPDARRHERLSSSTASRSATRTGRFGGGVGDSITTAFPTWPLGGELRTLRRPVDAGQTFVLYGGHANLAALDLADGSPDGQIDLAELDGTHGFTINGAVAGEPDRDGSSGAGDLNGDHVDDLVIATNWAIRPAGRSTWSSAATPPRATPSRRPSSSRR